ncbi:sensor histidine kinase [Roseibacillus ishigakijimensis]|uniref:histidine kinase n=1 Tax=Roseibacillus ishigakijimensis TaxID=454146 RepID=A0A934RT66_9BACT|nr:HAMP domain-containing sensor histidine kinase [Roseibacillus ishigakijimensis]MBK1835482.1 HAMP domain-containing histidine kinase [Roseibacillus ishigakijimensis]
MSRDRGLWLALVVCGGLILAAFASLSIRLLDMEQQRYQDIAGADLEERSRLALAQMDGAAHGLLIAENQRPAEAFQAVMPDGQLSPLLAGRGDFVRLYFEIDAQGQIRSPQVPSAEERSRVRAAGVGEEELAEFSEKFTALKAVLNRDFDGLKGFQIACAEVSSLTDWNEAFQQQRPDWAVAPESKQAPAYQEQFNNAVRSKRAAVLDEATRKVQGNSFAWGRSAGPRSLGAFAPLWLDKELFLIRDYQIGEERRRQGIWLRADELRENLLAGVKDWLAKATLEPVGKVNSADPLALVSLPWRLARQESPHAEVPGWTPLRISLLVGWMALILALLAASFLVRGVVRLSERRADFVSSVTHELRTPLTTFRLYSGMLVDGMVPEGEKRQRYLETMSSEAERLHHLVENVLAYSRLERGGPGVRMESSTLGVLWDRCCERLRERVEQENARFVLVNASPDFALTTDLSGVEQILFNLVDNACKYGLPESGPREVRVEVVAEGREARILVCDRGRGIRFSERRRLFRPFHKSATAAASSQPGVGLGLSLCRRLARLLGGDLTLERVPEGACFQLRLRGEGRSSLLVNSAT